MKRIRTVRPVGSAALVALTLAVCLASAGGASAMPLTATQRSEASFTAADREALASLLACLTDAAKQTHNPRIAPAGPATTSPVTGAASLSLQSLPSTSDLDRTLPPGSPLRPALMNLPPPAAN